MFLNTIAYAIILTLTTHLLGIKLGIQLPIASVIGMLITTVVFIVYDKRTVRNIYRRLHTIADSSGLISIVSKSMSVHTTIFSWLLTILAITYIVSAAFRHNYSAMLIANVCVLAVVNFEAYRTHYTTIKAV